MSCLFPFTVKNKQYIDGLDSPEFSHHLVPCGKCKDCLQARSNAWSLRLSYHLKDAETAYFVTLTYAQPPRTYNGLLTCKKDDIQKYFKRLRKIDGSKQLKYYAVSEYGDQYQRPHYHAIVFNVHEKRNLFKAWSINDKYIGQVDIGDVTPASIAYVTSYIGKKKIPMFDYDDRLKEFSLMSKKLGINYLHYAYSFHADNLQSWTRLGKTKMPLPRYLKQKIFSPNELKIIAYENYARKLEVEATKTTTSAIEFSRAKARKDAFELHQKDRYFITENLC